jgi:pimeloyl-ACP methyl ester carboxylesterase
MTSTERKALSRPVYRRLSPLVLINGLAEQPETWYCNIDVWRRYFDVHAPQLIAYEGTGLHRRTASGRAIDIDYIVGRLRQYLKKFVQSPPYHMVANSLGGKIAIEFAARFPRQVNRMVLLCPSGFCDVEKLPLGQGLRHKNPRTLAKTILRDVGHADPGLFDYYGNRFRNRRWRRGLLQTIRGTLNYRVRDRLPRIAQPTLVVVGTDDRIVDPQETITAARLLPRGRLVVLEACGHAPQIERTDIINALVVRFLQSAAVDADSDQERVNVE